MSRTILVSNASHDAPTEYSESWFSKIVDLVKKRPDTILFELRKEKANRKELEELSTQWHVNRQRNLGKDVSP